MNILVVDDEQEIADLIEIYLTNANYQVYKYDSSKDVLKDLEQLKIDLAILDVMMPEMDGFALCEKIRERYRFPIIFVTAKVEDMDKINGLTIGADDYITKPFQPLELIARVKAQLRRYKNYDRGMAEEDQDRIEFRGIVIDHAAHVCFLNEEKLELTPIEFEILWYLCMHRGKAVKTDELFWYVWKEKYFEKDNNTVMVHIRHLREKMKDTGKRPKYIVTVWGVGYKIEKS